MHERQDFEKRKTHCICRDLAIVSHATRNAVLFYILLTGFAYIRLLARVPGHMSGVYHARPFGALLYFFLAVGHLVACHAMDEAHCLRTHKEITSSCSDNSNACLCALQKIKCRTTSQCASVIADNQMCVNQLNHDNNLWIANCGIYHDNDLSLTIIGWVVVYIIAGIIAIVMWNKSGLEQQGNKFVPNMLLVFLFVGIIVTGALCFRDVFLVLMVAMVCILFLVITIAMTSKKNKETDVHGTPESEFQSNQLVGNMTPPQSGSFFLPSPMPTFSNNGSYSPLSPDFRNFNQRAVAMYGP